MADGTVWDILIATIPHRHEKLCELLAELDKQMLPGAGVRLYRDNLRAGYGAQCQALLESSGAEYVSFIDDDDWLAPRFIWLVLAALKGQPDYVGFPVLYTLDGEPQPRVEHSLRHTEWLNEPDLLSRDIVHFNPIRRELALLGRWEGGNGADRRWADGVRGSGQVRTETWIAEQMYYYRCRSTDTFLTPREPWPMPLPELPEYPWLTVL